MEELGTAIAQRRASLRNLRQLPDVQAAFNKARDFRKGNPLRTAHAQTYYQSLVRQADRSLKLAKRSSWRNFTGNSPNVFRTARLGESLCQPLRAPYLAKLIIKEDNDDNTSETSKVKVCDTISTICRALRNHWWPKTNDAAATPIPQPDADPQREQHLCYQGLEDGEVGQLIGRLKVNTRGGDDEITNRFLMWTKDLIVPYLEHLFQACLQHSHESDRFKHAITLVLKKSGPRPCHDPGSWRPIALLSSIGKLLEAIVAHRLRDLNIQQNLLPAAQFGVAGRNTTDALRRLLDPVYLAWSLGLYATFLSRDITGAYNRVDREKLLQALREKGVPDWIIKFVWSFCSNCSTSLEVPGHESQESFFVNVGIPQGSPLSPILFSFFAAPLLDRLAQEMAKKTGHEALAFVDDTYIIVISESYEENCRFLEKYHATIMTWAEQNSVAFNPEKYEVFHFRKRGHDPSLAMPNIPGLKIRQRDPRGNPALKVLGFMIDDRLTWQGHVEEIKKKVRAKMRRLGRISNTTSGSRLLQLRHLYMATIRPIIAYGCAVWFLRGVGVNWALSNALIQQLHSLEYQYLVRVAGCYKQIAGHYLYKELHIQPIELYLEGRAQAARARARSHELDKQTVQFRSCPSVVGNIRKTKAHPYDMLDDHALNLQRKAKQSLLESNDQRKPAERKDWDKKVHRAKAINACVREMGESSASQSWKTWKTEHQTNRANNQPALWDDWGKKNLSRYKDLSRAQSSILLLCRTGVGGLRTHLYKLKVSETNKCECGERQTAQHLFCHCPRLKEARSVLRQKVGHTDFGRLMRNDTKEAADWAISFFGIASYDWPRMNEPNIFRKDMLRISLRCLAEAGYSS